MSSDLRGFLDFFIFLKFLERRVEEFDFGWGNVIWEWVREEKKGKDERFLG